jgi:hypothetical protein
MNRLMIILPLCYLIVLASVIVSGASYLIQGAQIIRTYRKAKQA